MRNYVLWLDNSGWIIDCQTVTHVAPHTSLIMPSLQQRLEGKIVRSTHAKPECLDLLLRPLPTT